MGYRDGNPNTRKQIANFSVDEWIEFRERLAKIKKSNKITDRDYRILEELIVKMKSTAQLSYLAKNDIEYSWLKSNQNKPMSCRRIQQILTEHFPEFHTWQTHKGTKPEELQRIRSEQWRIIQERKRSRQPQCGMCGSTEQLELHHLLPIVLGGTNDERNLIFLCETCHNAQTQYLRERLRELKEVNNDKEGRCTAHNQGQGKISE